MVCIRVGSQVQTCVVLFLSLLLASHSAFVSGRISDDQSRGKIGVDYGLNGDNLISPAQTVKLLQSKAVTRVRTYGARSDVTQAFKNKGFDLVIGVINEDVPKLAASLGEAITWVKKHVVPFPRSGISAIIVGNEWLSNSLNNRSVLVPAIQNIDKALSTLKISGIKVSTAHAFDVLKIPSYPPSIARFKDEFVGVLTALVDFLDSTGSFFMVNIFPYFAYLQDKGVSRELALFKSRTMVTDPNTGLNYTNLFDLQLDAVYEAIASLPSSSSSLSLSENESGEQVIKAAKKHGSKPAKPNVQVGEAGWSSDGSRGSHTPAVLSSDSPSALTSASNGRCVCKVATVKNARTFNQNLIRHVLQVKGTPANPNTPIVAYIFEIFNEDLKPAGPEQNFGLFYPNGTARYPISFK